MDENAVGALKVTPSGVVGSFGLRRHTDALGPRLDLEGELDLASAPQLEQALRDATATSPGRILIDLGELAFMDCIGVGVLIRAQDAADAGGHQLALAHAPQQVRRLLELTQLIDRFTFED